MNMKVKIILGLVIAGVVFTGCLPDVDPITEEEALAQNIAVVDKNQLAADLAIIDDSLEKWQVDYETEPYGVRYEIITLGTGPKPKLSSQIRVKYEGKLLTSKYVFDKNETGAYFILSGLIVGWQTAFQQLPEGTVARLYIPSGYAYGTTIRYDAQGQIQIPRNSNLIFDVTLMEVD